MKPKINQTHFCETPNAQLGWWPPGWQLCLSCRLLARLRVLINPWAHANIGTGITTIQ